MLSPPGGFKQHHKYLLPAKAGRDEGRELLVGLFLEWNRQLTVESDLWSLVARRPTGIWLAQSSLGSGRSLPTLRTPALVHWGWNLRSASGAQCNSLCLMGRLTLSLRNGISPRLIADSEEIPLLTSTALRRLRATCTTTASADKFWTLEEVVECNSALTRVTIIMECRGRRSNSSLQHQWCFRAQVSGTGGLFPWFIIITT